MTHWMDKLKRHREQAQQAPLTVEPGGRAYGQSMGLKDAMIAALDYAESQPRMAAGMGVVLCFQHSEGRKPEPGTHVPGMPAIATVIPNSIETTSTVGAMLRSVLAGMVLEDVADLPVDEAIQAEAKRLADEVRGLAFQLSQLAQAERER